MPQHWKKTSPAAFDCRTGGILVNIFGRLVLLAAIMAVTIHHHFAIALQHNPFTVERKTDRSANLAEKSASWHPPTLPIGSLFYSPCNFPMHPAFRRRYRQQKLAKHNRQPFLHDGIRKAAEYDASSICHTHRHVPFICDLHGSLSRYTLPPISKIYHNHLDVLRQQNGSPAFVILIVRQLLRPISPLVVTNKSNEFGCLFHETMKTDFVHKHVRNGKSFAKIYASALFDRWFGAANNNSNSTKCLCARVLGLVLLDGVLPNPRKLTSVIVHTDTRNLVPFIANIQPEMTNMLLQGVPLGKVMVELVDQVGHALREYYLTGGRIRKHGVPLWAWTMAIVSLLLIFISLLAEWIVVRRMSGRKMRASEMGKIKAVIKSKTHIIF